MRSWQEGLAVLPCRHYADPHGNLLHRPVWKREMKQRLLVPRSKAKDRTICFTEDQSGSDLGGQELWPQGTGGWRINGRKQWITNGPICEFATVMATVDPKLGLKVLILLGERRRRTVMVCARQRLHKLGSMFCDSEVVLDMFCSG